MLLYHVCENKSSASAFAMNWLYKHLASLWKAFLNETVCDSKMLLWVLLDIVLDLDVQVFKVFLALCVGFASDIQDVRHALIDQLLCFKSSLKWAHVDAVLNLNQLYFLYSLLALDFARAQRHVGKPQARHVLFFRVKFSSCLFILSSGFCSIYGFSPGHSSWLFHYFLKF